MEFLADILVGILVVVVFVYFVNRYKEVKEQRELDDLMEQQRRERIKAEWAEINRNLFTSPAAIKRSTVVAQKQIDEERTRRQRDALSESLSASSTRLDSAVISTSDWGGDSGSSGCGDSGGGDSGGSCD